MATIPKELFIKSISSPLETLEENPMGGGREARPNQLKTDPESHKNHEQPVQSNINEPVEIIVPGYGRLPRDKVEQEIKIRLSELAKKAEEGNWNEVAIGLLRQESVLKAMVRAIVRAIVN